jgi:hypothetical protein
VSESDVEFFKQRQIKNLSESDKMLFNSATLTILEYNEYKYKYKNYGILE